MALPHRRTSPSCDPTYIAGNTAAAQARRRNLNRLIHTYLVDQFKKLWPDVANAVDLNEHDNNASPYHVRDAAGNIIERYPAVPLLQDKIQKHLYEGATIHNKSRGRVCDR